MENRIALYPVSLAHGWHDEPFDASVLPADIVAGVRIESVKDLFKKDEFDHLKGFLAKRDVDALKAVDSAIVSRYQLDAFGQGDTNAEALVRNVAACLRLIRPMQQSVAFMRGQINPDNTVNVQSFDNPPHLIHVPLVQKLFALRNTDLLRLQKVAAEFLRAMNGEFWKFRLAVASYEAGHFADYYWKGKFSLWCSALEAIYTTQPAFGKPKPFDHSGSTVGKARIKWFLGAKTPIYAPGDIQSVDRQPSITIEDILDDLYELRNSVAHGDKTPDKFFVEKRIGYGQSLNLADVLHEALSFIIRASLLRILEDKLLDHFADGPASEAYFGAQGLTRSLLPKGKTS
jgi:hypothetical protein